MALVPPPQKKLSVSHESQVLKKKKDGCSDASNPSVDPANVRRSIIKNGLSQRGKGNREKWAEVWIENQWQRVFYA